jgi:hypothetical protein
MEQILGVTYDASKHKTHEHWVESRIDTVEADALDQAEGDNKARTRYQRMFWEPVVEGRFVIRLLLLVLVVNLSHQEPVLPTALRKAREDAKRHGRSEESTKSVCSFWFRNGGIANTSGTLPWPTDDQVY